MIIIQLYANIYFYKLLQMEASGEQIIEELRMKVEQQAQRRSQKLKAEATSSHKSNADTPTQGRPKTTNIFMNFKKPESSNLFGNEKKTFNLFQIKQTNTIGNQNGAQQGAKNIFVPTQKPSIVQNDQNDQGSGDDAGELPEQSQNIFKSDPDVKIMKYEYKSQLVKLTEISLKKFKNGTALAKQNIYVSLQKLPNQPSSLYLLIRSNATKLLVYQGIMIKNISKLEHFMGKVDNLKFDVLSKRQTQNTQLDMPEVKKTREVVKLQFQNVEDCEKFKSEVEVYFGLRNNDKL